MTGAAVQSVQNECSLLSQVGAVDYMAQFIMSETTMDSVLLIH